MNKNYAVWKKEAKLNFHAVFFNTFVYKYLIISNVSKNLFTKSIE